MTFRSILILSFTASSMSFASEEVKKVSSKESTLPKSPLFFDVKDNELKIKPPVFQYDLESSGGKALQMGAVEFNDQSIRASIHGDSLKLDWNPKLIEGGELTIIDRRGTETWKGTVKEGGTWTYKYRQGDNPISIKAGDQFRYCLRDKTGEEYVNLCSRWYGAENRSGELYVGALVSNSSPRTIFQQEESKLKGRPQVDVTAPVSFFATLASGDTYEFRTSVPPLDVLDMALAEDPNEVSLTGALPRPVNIETKEIVGEEYGSLVLAAGFEKTIAEKSNSWSGLLKLAKPEIQLPGSKGGIFLYELVINNPPAEKYRRYRLSREPIGIYGEKERKTVFDLNNSPIPWDYQVSKVFEDNRVYIEVAGEKTTHKNYLDIYRGASGEASFRTTGVGTASGQFSFFAEGHVSWWLNDLFNSQNYYFSRQRWGASARYFTSLMPLKEVKDSNKMLNVIQADVRYRLTPGIWERDETVGIIGSYESVKIAKFDVAKMGVGAFWARSMPRVIDKWFSMLPYMNYPKWVDMEFISYLSSMDKTKIEADYVVNFHGKVLWTKKVFGEAGFGVKNYNVQAATSDSKLKLTTFYGTVGLGINF